jgi:glycosyltransferase involved in cell wall biosynthesis
MPKKVIHIVSGDLWAGAETQIGLQLKAIRSQGVDAEILIFNKGTALERYEKLGIPCHFCDEGAPRFFSRALFTLAEAKPELLVAHGYKESCVAFLHSLKSSTPWVSTFHGYAEQHRGLAKYKMMLYSKLQRVLAKVHASRIVTVSKNLSEELGFAGNPKLQVIRNVAEALSPESISSETELRHPAILIVGRLVGVKRIDLAIEAFAKLEKLGEHHAHLYIIGSGPLESSLKEMSRSQDLAAERIHFLGFRSDAASLIQQSSILLLSSDSEGIPTVLLEAISANTPVVATAVGGIPEVADLLPNYPIRLATKGSSSSIAEALHEMLVETSAAVDVGSSGPAAEFEQHFSPQVAATQHLAMYRLICG